LICAYLRHQRQWEEYWAVVFAVAAAVGHMLTQLLMLQENNQHLETLPAFRFVWDFVGLQWLSNIGGLIDNFVPYFLE
jgi:hypothetical protein